MLAAPPAARLLDPVLPRPVTEEEYQHFRREGWVLLKKVISPTHITALRDDIMGVLKARNMLDSYLAQSWEYLRGSPLHGLMASTHLRAIAERLMGGPGQLYMPFTAVKGPGQGPFTFHQDNNYTLLDGEALNCWTAFTPMTVATGCLRIVPRSHLTGTVTSQASDECKGHRQVAAKPTSWVDVIMDPGDTVVFHRLTVHGSGANTTTDPRVAYAVQWSRQDCRGFWDDRWELLSTRPRHHVDPVDAFSNSAQRGE